MRISYVSSDVCSSDLTDIAVIIQDGGSTDKTAQVAEDFDRNRIHFLAEPDSGIYDAMNKAIARTTGTWLLFLGSDDYLYETTVLLALRNAFAGTTAHLVYGNVEMVRDNPWAKAETHDPAEITPTACKFENTTYQERERQ